MNAQRTAYLISRALGDVKAAKRGPDVLAKRLIRRAVTRRLFGLFGNGAGR
jgi:hypothetical protein